MISVVSLVVLVVVVALATRYAYLMFFPCGLTEKKWYLAFRDPRLSAEEKEKQRQFYREYVAKQCEEVLANPDLKLHVAALIVIDTDQVLAEIDTELSFIAWFYSLFLEVVLALPIVLFLLSCRWLYGCMRRETLTESYIRSFGPPEEKEARRLQAINDVISEYTVLASDPPSKVTPSSILNWYFKRNMERKLDQIYAA